MSKLMLSVFAAMALAVPSLALACPGHAEGASCAHEKEGGCPHAKEGGCPHAQEGGCACAKEGGCPHAAKGEGHAKGEGCACKHKHDQQASAWKKVSVGELASLLDRKSEVYVYDVNPDALRQKAGVIPGAKLLTSASQYDLAQLPQVKDRMLVFYCANTRCTASHQAAERALAAGYTNVSVLPDGIKGWTDAGKATSKPQS
jgi:rhodanese-related sulfurtransferase